MRENYHLTDLERSEILMFMLEESKNMKPKRGKMRAAATKFNVSRRSISKLWLKAKSQRLARQPVDIRAIRHGRTIMIHPNIELIISIPDEQRSTIRSAAYQFKISKTTMGRWAQRGTLKGRTIPMKPLLSYTQKVARIRFCLKKIAYEDGVFKFRSMRQYVHIDEKWFQLAQATIRAYKLPEEPDGYRACVNKKYIEKVMFLGVNGRPLLNANGETIFDGQFGIYPFTVIEAVKRNSKNRQRGTLVTKAVTSVTREVTRSLLVDEVVPVMKQLWPTELPKHIIIQQDNAKPHLCIDDEDFFEKVNRDGFTIELSNQPAMSPDLNILDLGLFRKIQSLQQKRKTKTLVELIDAVQQSYADSTSYKLNNIWITLQSCMIEVIKRNGGNNYPIPHMGKDHLHSIGELPEDLTVPEEVVRKGLLWCQSQGETAGLEYLMDALNMSRTWPDMNFEFENHE